MEIKVESRKDAKREKVGNRIGAPWRFRFYRTMSIGVGVPALKTYSHHAGRGGVV